MSIDIMEPFRKARQNRQTQFLNNLGSAENAAEPKKEQEELCGQALVDYILEEFNEGRLFTEDGEPVIDEDMALVMALNEAGLNKGVRPPKAPIYKKQSIYSNNKVNQKLGRVGMPAK